MAVRITLQQLPGYLEKEVTGRRARAEGVWKREAIVLAKQLIDESLEKGISPVEKGGDNTGGKARFKEYSTTYKSAIRQGRYAVYGKRLRPVNLKLSGRMRNSIKGRTARIGFSLFYTDPKFKYHNELGAGKSKVIRQILPREGQNFSRAITRHLAQLYVDLFDRIR